MCNFKKYNIWIYIMTLVLMTSRHLSLWNIVRYTFPTKAVIQHRLYSLIFVFSVGATAVATRTAGQQTNCQVHIKMVLSFRCNFYFSTFTIYTLHICIHYIRITNYHAIHYLPMYLSLRIYIRFRIYTICTPLLWEYFHFNFTSSYTKSIYKV